MNKYFVKIQNEELDGFYLYAVAIKENETYKLVHEKDDYKIVEVFGLVEDCKELINSKMFEMSLDDMLTLAKIIG